MLAIVFALIALPVFAIATLLTLPFVVGIAVQTVLLAMYVVKFVVHDIPAFYIRDSREARAAREALALQESSRWGSKPWWVYGRCQDKKFF